MFFLNIGIAQNDGKLSVIVGNELHAQQSTDCPNNVYDRGSGFGGWLAGIWDAVKNFFKGDGTKGEVLGEETVISSAWVNDLLNPINGDEPFHTGGTDLTDEEATHLNELYAYYQAQQDNYNSGNGGYSGGNSGSTGGGYNPNIPIPQKDCAGVIGGTAHRDTCGICVAGTTGKLPCICPTDANFTVTKDMLLVINPSGDKDKMDSVLKYINLYKNDVDFNVNTRLRLAHFLAQITAETDGFTIMAEDYHYSKKTLLKKKKLFDSTNINQYYNCVCVFDKLYCCENENGDATTQDGSKYRGKGVIQLTWKEMYRKFTSYYQTKFNDNSVDFVANPDLLTTNMKYSVLSALWEACKYKKLNTYADNDDVLGYSRGINIGNPKSDKTPNGLTKRENNLKAAKKALCL